MHLTIGLAVFGVLVCLCATSPAEPQVSNRAAKADEWGYRPADGETARMNPPSLTWLHETEAQTYTVQWARRADFSDAETASGFRWPTYTHHTALTAGTYHWRYRFTSRKGETSAWSAIRKFTVPADAVEFPMPTRAQQRERVPQGHPRLFMRPEDLPRLRELARGKLATSFTKLREQADKVIAAGPTPEPAQKGSARDKENKELIKFWWPNREQAQKAGQEAELIAFVYLMTAEPKYGEAARKWVLHLASWDPDGPTHFQLNCEAGKAMLYRPCRAYDWAYDTLTADDRAKVQQVMKRRALDAWKSGEIALGAEH